MSLSRGGINKTVNLGLTPVCPFFPNNTGEKGNAASVTPRSDAAKQDGPSEFRESLQFRHILSLSTCGEAAPSWWITIGRKWKCARKSL